jgi:parvulin-like peptidyl-prolyl isomerase
MSLTRMRQKFSHVLNFGVWIFIAIFVITATVMFSGSGLSGLSGSGGSQGGEDAFAEVNGQTITNGQFRELEDNIRQQIKQYSPPGQPVTMQQQGSVPRYAWEQILSEYATAEVAKKRGVTADDGEAQAEIERMADQQAEIIGKGLSVDEMTTLRQNLIAGKDPESVRRQLLGQRLNEKLTKDVRPVEVQVAHVLIKTDTRSEDAARKIAEDVARQARAGSDFAALAKKYSEDEGSKVKDGVVGWASAMPMPPDPAAKKKPAVEPATTFVPEFTAASLLLRPGQVSDPVRSTFGYHVIKVVAERPYQPTGKDVEKDPKKREEALQQYKTTAVGQISQGLVSEAKRTLPLKPVSPWLKGYLAEQEPPPPPTPTDPKAAKPAVAPGLNEAITAYQQALDKNDPAADASLAYKLAQLYQRAAATEKNPTPLYEKALANLQKWDKRSSDAELFVAEGELLEKLKRKSDALEAYKTALDKWYREPGVLTTLAEKFKALGRTELAQQARKKDAEEQARQAAETKRQQEAMAKISTKGDEKKDAGKTLGTVTVKTGAKDPKTGKVPIVSVTPGEAGDKKDVQGAKTDAVEKSAPKEGASAGSTKPGDVVGEVTVKTGPIDPKTGKPTILSVTQTGPDGKKTTTTPGTPAAPTKK